MRYRHSPQPAVLNLNYSTFIFLLFSMQVFGAETAIQKDSESWFSTNATLVKPVPISLCKPKAVGLFAPQLRSCKHKEQLNAPVRVRLLEGLSLKNKTFIKMQFMVDDVVLAAWARMKEKASIELDPGADLFLPATPSLKDQSDLLTGRWNIDYWEIFKHGNNHHSGYIDIEKEEKINEYLGRLVVTLKFPPHSFSHLLTGGSNSQSNIVERTFKQKMRFLVNGNLLFGKERKRRFYRLSDQMMLELKDNQLEGYAGLPHYNGHSKIKLTRTSESTGAVAGKGE